MASVTFQLRIDSKKVSFWWAHLRKNWLFVPERNQVTVQSRWLRYETKWSSIVANWCDRQILEWPSFSSSDKSFRGTDIDCCCVRNVLTDGPTRRNDRRIVLPLRINGGVNSTNNEESNSGLYFHGLRANEQQEHLEKEQDHRNHVRRENLQDIQCRDASLRASGIFDRRRPLQLSHRQQSCHVVPLPRPSRLLNHCWPCQFENLRHYTGDSCSSLDSAPPSGGTSFIVIIEGKHVSFRLRFWVLDSLKISFFESWNLRFGKERIEKKNKIKIT